MGKFKDKAIEEQNKIEEQIKELEEETQKLKCEEFPEEVDVGKLKSTISDFLKIVKDFREAFLL